MIAGKSRGAAWWGSRGSYHWRAAAARMSQKPCRTIAWGQINKQGVLHAESKRESILRYKATFLSAGAKGPRSEHTHHFVVCADVTAWFIYKDWRTNRANKQTNGLSVLGAAQWWGWCSPAHTSTLRPSFFTAPSIELFQHALAITCTIIALSYRSQRVLLISVAVTIFVVCLISLETDPPWELHAVISSWSEPDNCVNHARTKCL